ncbi:MAG: hypothetical protein V6Z81_03665 [Parvularculales bacterium]
MSKVPKQFRKHAFKKGQGGRPPGALNKKTLTVGEILQQAFEKSGGYDALVRFAKKNPKAFYTRIWIKLLPYEMKAKKARESVPHHERLEARLEEGRRRAAISADSDREEETAGLDDVPQQLRKHAFKKGQGGRTPGALNKKTLAYVDLIRDVFEEIGGLDALTEFAKKEPLAFFRMWIKLVPYEIEARQAHESACHHERLVAKLHEGRLRAAMSADSDRE